MGAIGKAIGRRLEAFGCEIRYTSRSAADVAWRREPTLMGLAAWAEDLFVIVPGGPETAGMVDAAVLAALGPDGVLVNVARGEVVDEAALVAALEAGKLGGAGLDVFTDEPQTPHALWSRDDVVLLPHVGSATREARAAMAEMVLHNLDAFFRGDEAGLKGRMA
jgi:lactate dehydrogenase-like 2-hydroxyacid dehydrogenase